MNLRKPDWNQIKADYIAGKGRKEICEEYKVKYKTLDNRIIKGKWRQEERDIQGKARELRIETASLTIAEKQIQAIEEQTADSARLLEQARDAENEPMPDVKSIKLQHLKLLTEIYLKAYQIRRQAIGLSDTTDIRMTVKKDRTLTNEELAEEIKKRKLPISTIEE